MNVIMINCKKEWRTKALSGELERIHQGMNTFNTFKKIFLVDQRTKIFPDKFADKFADLP